MSKRQSISKTRTTLIATAVLLVCVALPWACEFDTTPKILRHPPVEKADDADSGDEK